MTALSNKELMNINGGGIMSFLNSATVGIAIGLIFIGSVIYGYIHPVKCS